MGRRRAFRHAGGRAGRVVDSPLDQLPLPHRSVLLLYFVEDFSIAEIAGITGSQPGTVKSRLHYAKKSLRKLLEVKNENSA